MIQFFVIQRRRGCHARKWKHWEDNEMISRDIRRNSLTQQTIRRYNQRGRIAWRSRHVWSIRFVLTRIQVKRNIYWEIRIAREEKVYNPWDRLIICAEYPSTGPIRRDVVSVLSTSCQIWVKDDNEKKLNPGDANAPRSNVSDRENAVSIYPDFFLISTEQVTPPTSIHSSFIKYALRDVLDRESQIAGIILSNTWEFTVL